MKQILNKSEAKLIGRILRVVSIRMEGRDKSGMWAPDDEAPEYFKETISPNRGVMIDLDPAEARTLARVIEAKPTDPAPLTPREEGLLKELRRFVAHIDGIPEIEEMEYWRGRFAEIAAKMEGK